MKRYCKDIDISDVNFILNAIFDCFNTKWHRRDVVEIITEYNKNFFSIDEIKEYISNKQYEKFKIGLNNLALEISEKIKNHTLEIPNIQRKTIVDGNNGKVREIGIETMLHQIYDYIAVNAISPLCNAKIGATQMACIKGRGQVYGKNRIEKWLKCDEKNTHYCIKMDIKKCYPSIDHIILKKFLRRDIKNPNLIWLLEKLISKYEIGLSIGSYLSAHLCNYFLSYIYHYATEQLFVKTTRRSHINKKRLFSHILFYMDDIIILGSNKKDLLEAFYKIEIYTNSVLSLKIKNDWKLFKVKYTDRHGKEHGNYIDMMGYRISRTHTTVRKNIFQKCRKYVFKVEKNINKHKKIKPEHARTLMAYFGWLCNSDSHNFILNHDNAFRVAKHTISNEMEGD